VGRSSTGEPRQGGEREGVRVEDTVAVVRELVRYRALLQQLEGREFHMEEIVATATELHPGHMRSSTRSRSC
jgi:hypothetical protein